MKPSDPVPLSLADFQGRSLFTKYMEKSGGFQGQRDFGLVMWLLAHIADQMVAADYKGAQELLALTLVTVEQAAQDGGKWDVAWLLSLQEDPPPGVFQARPAATNPRLRAFAALCPPDWAAVALAYVKEVDLINSRRQESLVTKKTNLGKGEEEAPKKKPPRHAKKGKGGEAQQ